MFMSSVKSAEIIYVDVGIEYQCPNEECGFASTLVPKRLPQETANILARLAGMPVDTLRDIVFEHPCNGCVNSEIGDMILDSSFRR